MKNKLALLVLKPINTTNNEIISRFNKRTNKLLRMHTVCKHFTVLVLYKYV